MDDLIQYVENCREASKRLRSLISQMPGTGGTRLREGVLRLEAAIYYMESAIADAAEAA